MCHNSRLVLKKLSSFLNPSQLAMLNELSGSGESIDEVESVEELRAKLANMKRLMEERKGTTLGEISARKMQRNRNADMIDGTFLSWIFGTALGVIISVTIYAFYNLFNAVFKKFQSKHTEL